MHVINWSPAGVLLKKKKNLSLPAYSIQVCVNTMPEGKDIRFGLKVEITYGHLSGKVYKAIFKQFDVHHSPVRKLIHKCITFKTLTNL